jgi:hypothetical protein
MHTLAQSMDITIVDEQNKETSLKYTADQYSYSTAPLTIQQIQKHVAQQSGLTIQKNHITRALQFLAPSSDQEIIKPCMLGQHTTAAALYFADYWDVPRDIKYQLGSIMLTNGYMNLVCKYIAQTKEQNSHVVTSLIPFINASGIHAWPYYIEQKTLKQIYNTMYASDEFQDLIKRVTPKKNWLDTYTSWIPFRTPSEFTDEHLVRIKQAATEWKNLPITQLFNALCPRDIDTCLYWHFIHRPLSQEEKGTKGIIADILASKNTLFDRDETDPCIFSRGTHMFTHIPLIYISNILEPQKSIWENNSYDIWYIENSIFCTQDTKILKLSHDQTYTQVNFYQCILSKLPKIETLRTCAHQWTFPKKTFEDDNSIHKILAPHAYKVTDVTYHMCHFGKKEAYHFMPSYWPWLKFSSFLLFSGCTIAAMYYFYKQMQTDISNQETYIASQPAYIQEQVLHQVTPQTAPLYKYVIEKNYAHDIPFRQTMHDTIHTINQTPACNSAHISHQDYLDISNSIKPLYQYWTNVPFSGRFTGILKMAGTLLYGGLISTIQWFRFRYGSPRRDDIDSNFYLGKPLFEPLLLLETLFGLNKRDTIIQI